MNMKKLFAILIAGLLACSLIACSKDDDKLTGDDNNVIGEEMVYGEFTYDVNGEGTYEITGYTYTGTKPVDVVIPDVITTSDNQTRAVTGIGDDAFKAMKTVRSVKIPDSILYIGQFAFYDCDAITSVEIPDSVTEIGVGAFSCCDKLATVKLPTGLKAIENSTFKDCIALTGVTLPEGLESIGEAAFWGCEAITEITVPTSVKDMGDAAFYLCKNLKKATVLGDALGKTEESEDGDKTEHTIGEIIFKSCADDLEVVVTEGTEFAKYAEDNKYNVTFNVVAE